MSDLEISVSATKRTGYVFYGPIAQAVEQEGDSLTDAIDVLHISAA